MNLTTASGQDLTEAAKAAIDAARYDLRSAFRIPQFWDEGDGGDGGDGGEGDEGDEGASGSEGDDGNDGTDIKDPDKKRLSDEAAAARVAKKAAEKERDDALARVREFEDKDKTATEKATRDLAEATEKLASAQTDLTVLRVENAALKAAAKFNFVDTDVAVDLAIKRAGLKGDEDDLADQMADALEELSKDKKYKYLIKSGDESDDDEDRTQQEPSGSRTNGSRKDKSKLDEQKLREKFPALNH